MKNLKNKTKEAGDGFTVFKGIVANLASQAISSAINGVKRLSSEIVNIGKQAISNYASYEQLIGGVETLFKESSKLVSDYANNAYKTAGLSANNYMETVTSFSASLLQGLGGNTKKAAEIANLAITDMSDNANKMGTDMSSIQNAYQGFAKQNYTMLDNLKLGYGGTQAEMIRLINDSGVLKKKIKDLDKVSFDTIIQAIHKVQDSMGITGTTALEASTTIEGSINSMKSAWSNLLTGIASENVNTEDLVKNFTDSVKTVAKNLLPVVKTTIKGIGVAVKDIIKESIPEDTFNKITDFLNWVKTHGSEIVSTVTAIVTGFMAFKTFSFIAGIVGTFSNLFNVIKSGVGIVKALNIALNLNPFVLIATAVVGLVAGLISLWKTNENFRNAVINTWNNVKDTISKVVDKIKGFFTQTIPNMFNSFLEKISSFKDKIIQFFKDIPKNLNKIFSDFFQPIQDGFSKLYENITSTLEKVVEKVITFFQELPGKVLTFFQELPYKIGYALGESIGNIYMFASDVWNFMSTKIPEIIEGIGLFFSELPGKIWEWLLNTYTNITNWGNNVKSKAIEVGTEFLNNVITFFTQLPGKIWEWLLNTYTNITNWGNNVKSKAIEVGTEFLNNVITFFTQLPGKIWEFLTNVINKVRTWSTDMSNKAKEGAQNTYNNIVNTINELPGKMLEIGKNIVEGLWNGIMNAKNWMNQKVSQFASGILDGMKSAFGIHSPSTVFRDIVGKNIALGIGERIQ